MVWPIRSMAAITVGVLLFSTFGVQASPPLLIGVDRHVAAAVAGDTHDGRQAC